MDIDNTMLHCLSYIEDKVSNRDLPQDRIDQIQALKAFSEEFKRDYIDYYRYLAKHAYCNIIDETNGNTIKYTIAFRPGIFKFLLQVRSCVSFRISTTGTR